MTPETLRDQRANPSVLKANLARMRERQPCAMVIVLEGKEDLPVYEVWFKRLLGEFEWEPLLANGKKNLLEFRDLVRRDRTGIAVCTYFITDHDYDGLRGFEDGEDIYVLPAYSVENYLADEIVLDSVLRTDMHVIGDPARRGEVVELFERLRGQFLEAMLLPCIRLYGARNESVGNVIINEAVTDFVAIGLTSVMTKAGAAPVDAVTTDREVSEEGICAAREFFNVADRKMWVRGKFVMEFFKKFCALVYEDRRSVKPTLFSEACGKLSFSPASLDFRSLAARSPLPNALGDVLSSWGERCREECGAH